MIIIDGTIAITERLTGKEIAEAMAMPAVERISSPKYPGLYVQIAKCRTEGAWFLVEGCKRRRVGYWPDFRTGCAAMARADALVKADESPAPSPLYQLLTRRLV